MIVKQKKNEDRHSCPGNGAVVCMNQTKCDRCGWNPDVAAERLRRIEQQRRNGGRSGEQKKK